MKRARSLEQRIAVRIAKSKQDVFLREDFEDLGGYDQVGRCLRSLIAKNKVIKIGHGLYAKTRPSPLSGRPVPRLGIRDLASEALHRLHVPTAPSSYEQAYNSGRSTQVPTGRVIGVKSRIARKIGYDGKYVTFERVH